MILIFCFTESPEDGHFINYKCMLHAYHKYTIVLHAFVISSKQQVLIPFRIHQKRFIDWLKVGHGLA